MAVVLLGHEEEPPKSPLLAEVKKAKPKGRGSRLSVPSCIDVGLDGSGSARAAGCQETGHSKCRNRFVSEPTRVSQAFLQPPLAAETSLPSLRPRSALSALRDENLTSKSARKDSCRFLAPVEMPLGRKLGNCASLSQLTRSSSKLAQLGTSMTRSPSRCSDVEGHCRKDKHRHTVTSMMPVSLPSANDAKHSKFRTTSTCDSFFDETNDQSEAEWPSLDDMDCTPTTARNPPFGLERLSSSESVDDLAPVINIWQPWSSEGTPRVATPIRSIRDEPALLPDVKLAPKGVTLSFNPSTSLTALIYSAKRGVKAQKTIDAEEEAKARKAKVEHAFYCFCAPGCKDLDAGRFKRLCLVSNVASGAFPPSDAGRWWSTIIGDKDIMGYEQFTSAIDLIASELKIPVEVVENKFVGATKPWKDGKKDELSPCKSFSFTGSAAQVDL